MRILLVHDFLDETGGAERIVHATKSLLEENGHEVSLYAPAKQRSPASRLFSLHHYFAVRRAIRRFKPDIMHAHGIYRNASPSVLLAARQMMVPVVMTLHDFQIVCPKTSLVDENLLSCSYGFGCRCFYSNCYPRKPFNRIYQCLKSIKLALHRFIILRTVRHFFCPSNCLLNWVTINFGLGNASYLPNFLPYDFGPSLENTRDSVLLFIGKLSDQKGLDVLLQAFARARIDCPSLGLKIIGDGPEELRLKELSASLQAEEYVVFAGKTSHQQVMREYSRALCIVIPSKYVENCPVVGIEALSKGNVVIASRIGGLPDLVDENETGFLVQPNDPEDLADKIIYIMQNRSLLSEMGRSARAKYERCFSKPEYSRALLEAYENTIQGTS